MAESSPSRRKANQSRIIKRVTSFISVLRHWGGIGVLILAALDSSVLPTLGGVDALTILLAARHPELWPYYAMCSTAGSLSGASLAYRLSALGVLHRRIKGAVFDRVTAFVERFGSLALSLAALPASISDFRIRDLGWCDALSLHCVCAVFRRRAGVPICFTSLSRVCVWQAVRGDGVVGAHSATSSGYRHCVGVRRRAVVACLQEI